MNHSRSNISIRYCTNCGELLNAMIKGQCNETLHAARRKNRNTFCHDCGQALTVDRFPKR